MFRKASEANSGDVFVLHDGPPYANGELHVGHALNKILKDFINRDQLLRGRRVRYVPGWDCHGLPIEMKVLQTLKPAERQSLTPIRLRQIARSFAEETMARQMTSFKRFGVWAAWSDSYSTMQSHYEAAQIRIFGQMADKGYIYRGRKPVHWSPSSRTALAEAELEYPDEHTSRSVYVAFQVTQPTPALQSLQGKTYLVIWTTTPWTLPANRAVAVNDVISYSIVRHPSVLDGANLIVATDAIDRLRQKFGVTEALEEVLTLTGKELEGVTYQHPLDHHLKSLPVVIGGDYITSDSGTGLVHTAPGHGQEDYLTGIKYRLDVFSPVDAAGRFTAEAGAELEGKEVLGSGNAAVIDMLRQSSHLLKEEAYKHKYPYDWRTKKPTIFRATEQWFASVEAFRDDALKAIDEVTWLPSVGRNRIASMVTSRGDWCISRQRAWGVPIPVFYNKSDGQPLLTSETVKHIEEVFRQHGSDAWWTMEVKDLLPEALRARADDYVRGEDTMDVWFDSGTSWSGVLQESKGVLTYPADVYLEGSDQSRGWFQSSLLTSVATTGKPPFKTVLTHGFTLDEKGYKMSKSLGNTIDPKEVIEGSVASKGKAAQPGFGADTLRLWVASVDYTGDVSIGTNIIAKAAESYRKIRNTVRYLLGALNDFHPPTSTVTYDNLPSLDKYMLGKLSKLMSEAQRAYEDYQYSKAMHALMQFLASDLSAFYLDVGKDRLYVSAPTAQRRLAAQTVLDTTVHQLLLLLAPILPHLTEEAWRSIPYNPDKHLSVFQKVRWTQRLTFPPHEEDRWGRVRALKDDVNKAIEGARQKKMVGAGFECKVVLWCDDNDFRQVLSQMKGDIDLLPQFESGNGVDDLRFLLAVSQVHVADTLEQLHAYSGEKVLEEVSREGVKYAVAVMKAEGDKCQRCWMYTPNLTAPEHSFPHTCPRCAHELQHR